MDGDFVVGLFPSKPWYSKTEGRANHSCVATTCPCDAVKTFEASLWCFICTLPIHERRDEAVSCDGATVCHRTASSHSQGSAVVALCEVSERREKCFW